jgi:hypothetical protein
MQNSGNEQLEMQNKYMDNKKCRTEEIDSLRFRNKYWTDRNTELRTWTAWDLEISTGQLEMQNWGLDTELSTRTARIAELRNSLRWRIKYMDS